MCVACAQSIALFVPSIEVGRRSIRFFLKIGALQFLSSVSFSLTSFVVGSFFFTNSFPMVLVVVVMAEDDNLFISLLMCAPLDSRFVFKVSLFFTVIFFLFLK